jgi:hypothetical protein
VSAVAIAVDPQFFREGFPVRSFFDSQADHYASIIPV